MSFIRLTSSLGGQYHAFFGLLPDYNFGFTLLSAADLDDLGSVIVNGIPNIVGNLMLPALDDVAKKQAICDFAGHYTSNTGNSSMKIAVSDARPGLEVTQWISNSVDLLEVLTATTPNLVYRIVPNHLFSGDKVGFTSFYQSATPPVGKDIWYGPCQGWVEVDEWMYANIPLGQMVFTVSEKGKATSVNLRALEETLQRSS